MTFTAKIAAAFVALALSGVLAGTGNARAEPAFSFATAPGKLPKTVVPIHYAIELKPDLETLQLAGVQAVDIEVREPTAQLVLNAVNITIGKAAIDGGVGAAIGIAFDSRAQTATLTFPRAIPAGRHTLRLDFGAQINKFGRGLFMVDYPTADGRKRMISSHNEPADARRIFPSWDEPAFKATFDLTVTVPKEFLAVSNMPVASERPDGEELKRVTFQRTPKMSSYLFVLVAGDLERTTLEAEGVTIGVVATRGKSENGRYALDSAAALLKYFNDYFETRYSLPKLDLIAVPGGFGGAMENWGGITFFESRLLFDPARSSRDARRSIFNILAHEMAHQWFGNLVTMAWWDNLWLNEGFASWMQAKSAEHLHPEWQVWLNTSPSKQGVMNQDARRTSHPVQQAVANESEASTVFDGITYNKGQALIRMLENFLGEDAFRAGIRHYMHRHEFGNTTTADLWRALEAASGKPIASIAASFTEQPGVPLIVGEVRCAGGEQRILLRQERFTIRDPTAKPQRWQVPVTVGPATGDGAARTVVVDGTAEAPAGRCGEPVKINRGDVGYFRVQYDARTHAELAKSIAQMAPADRLNLLSDTWALIESGRSPPGAFFELIDGLGGEDHRAVIEVVIRVIMRVDRLQWGRPGREAYQAYAREKLKPAFERLGWDATEAEAGERTLLRARLVRMLGDLGDESILEEARRRFAAFLKDTESLSTDLRAPVLHLAGRHADRETYDALLALGRKATNTEERVRYYSAAASALDPELAADTLAIALTDELPTSLVGTLISWVSSQGEHPELALAFVKKNFSALAAKQGPSFRNTFVSNLMSSFTERTHAAELAIFNPVHETSGGRIVAARATESILSNADFVDHQLPAIDEWIKRRAAQP